MNKTFKRVLLLAAVVCMFCALFAVASAETACVHVWKEDGVASTADVPACNKMSVYKWVCNNCPEVKYVARLGHAWDYVADYTTPADCENPKQWIDYCRVCQDPKNGIQVLKTEGEALGHELKVAGIVAADCVNPEGVKYVCDRGCGYFEVDAKEGGQAALGHQKYASEPLEKATCVSTGLTAEISCARCKLVLEEQVVIPVNPNAHGENLDIIWSEEPDCKTKTDGYGKYTCVCDAYKNATIIRIPWEHTYSNVVVRPATCNEDGRMDKVCDVCKDRISNIVIPATGEHNFEYDKPASEIAATCTEPKKVGYDCAYCGQVDANGWIYIGKAAGHTLVGKIVETPTCIYPTGLVKECAACDYWEYEEVENIKKVDALGHKPVADKDTNKAATCYKYGWAGATVCEVCRAVVDKGYMTPVDPTNHNWPETGTVVEAATCTEDGTTRFDCDDCDAYKYVTVKAAHKFALSAANCYVTCANDGWATKYCTGGCGYRKLELVKKEEYIALYGHDDVVDNFTVAADCVNPVRIGKGCRNCGTVLGDLEAVEGSEANGHSFTGTKEVISEANCLYPVGVVEHCANCDAVNIVPDVPGAVGLGHVEVAKDIAATCVAKGTKGRTVCDRCGIELKKGEASEIDKVNGHKAVVDFVLDGAEPDCVTGENGIAHYICDNGCGTDLGYAIVAPEHTFGTLIEEEPATCQKEGFKKYTCAECGRIITETLKKTDHKMVTYEWVSGLVDEHNTPGNFYYPACGSNGYMGSKCEYCDYGFATMTKVDWAIRNHAWHKSTVKDSCTTVAGELIECCYCKEFTFIPEDPNAVASHSYKAVEDKAATCRTPGEINKIECEVCHDVLQVTYTDIDPENHTPVCNNEFVPGYEPDCLYKKDGIGKFECKECGIHIEYAAVSYKEYGHRAGASVTTPATCTKDGKVVTKCTKCQLVIDEEVIKATGHNFVNGATIIVPADCENPQRVAVACVNYATCGEFTKAVAVENSKPLGHDYKSVFMPADCVDPARWVFTCAKNSKHTYTEAATGDLAQAAYGHKPVASDENKAATCKSTGLEGKIVCSVKGCGEVIEEGTVLPIDPTNHKYVPTAASQTIIDSMKCTDGAKILEFECAHDGCDEKTLVEYVKEHKFDKDNVKKHKVNKEETYIYVVCDYCTATEIVQWLIPHCDDRPGEPVKENVVEATCTEDGSYDEVVYCLACKEELSRETKTVEALGHKEETVAAKAATCTEAGYTEAVICSVCEEVLTAAEEIPALGHNEEELAAVEATCTTAGLTAGKKCVVCGVVTVEQEEIAALGHKEEEIPAVAADCTTAGLTAGKKCTVCGEETVKQEVVEALGHTVVVLEGKAATCTEAGLTAGEKCSVCEEILKAQEEIAALGHTVVVTEGIPATCDKPGMTAGKTCSVCGEAIEGAVEIPALGHKYTVTWDFNADFTKKIKISTCDVCGEVVKSEPMDF